MSVYDVAGIRVYPAFAINGTSALTVYDIDGNPLYNSWYDEISTEELVHPIAGTYYVTRIPKVRSDNSEQFPFVYAPNGTGAATQSTLQMNRQRGFYCAINAGIFDMPSSGLYTPIGTIIENASVIQQGNIADMTEFQRTKNLITIDAQGNLGYAETGASAETLIANGIVSAVHSFIPLIINFQDAYEITQNPYCLNEADAQRQIIGQFSNDDYVIITCEGRGFKNSAGFTMPMAREMCLNMGLKFAFNLDGGGSTETVIGDDQINTIYEGTTGRKVPTYIVFNGTDTFFIPNDE